MISLNQIASSGRSSYLSNEMPLVEYGESRIFGRAKPTRTEISVDTQVTRQLFGSAPRPPRSTALFLIAREYASFGK